jgi:N-acetylneuraminic acid mutarotase
MFSGMFSARCAGRSATTNTWRKLAAWPLAPSQSPAGAWDGHELILFVGSLDTDGKPWPAQLARAAAYDPATDTWRRIAPLPSPRSGAKAVWDGREVLLVGGAGAPRGAKPPVLARVGFAYNPATNRWRQLPSMGSGRTEAAMVWTGRRLLVWGGSQTADASVPVTPNRGLAYDPAANRWSPLPGTPLFGRVDPTAIWTGRSMIIWGGQKPNSPLGTGTRFFTDGAVFTPATP